MFETNTSPLVPLPVLLRSFLQVPQGSVLGCLFGDSILPLLSLPWWLQRQNWPRASTPDHIPKGTLNSVALMVFITSTPQKAVPCLFPSSSVAPISVSQNLNSPPSSSIPRNWTCRFEPFNLFFFSQFLPLDSYSAVWFSTHVLTHIWIFMVVFNNPD